MVQPFVSSPNEALKQRMCTIRFTEKFRMRLSCDKERMGGDLNHLDQLIIWSCAADNESGFFELFTVSVIEFVAMTMTFKNLSLSVKSFGK